MVKISQKLISLFLITSILLLTVVPTLAQDDEEPAENPAGVTMTAVAGYDQFYRNNNWFPVHITLANNGPQIEGYVEIETGSSSTNGTTYQLPVLLPTQSRQQATMIVYAPNFGAAIDVDLRDNDGNLLARSTETMRRINDGDLLYGVISPDPGEFTFLESLAVGARSSVAYLSLEQLPETAVAWKALDFLIFNDVDTAELSNAQQTALRQWVEDGGQLVVTGGSGWQKTSAGLTDLLPVTISGSRSVPDLPDLSAALNEPFRDPGPYLITESSLRSGDVLLSAENLPVLAKNDRGRGTVFFLALDPRFAPLLDWAGSDLIWQTIIDNLPPNSSFGVGPVNSYAANSAVSLLPSLALPSIITLLIFLLVYTLVIGPANYLVLKRRKRTELAWITIPGIVLIFSAATYVTGFQLRGNETIINQFAVAYSNAGAEQANVHTLVGLYSPRRSLYDLEFGPGVAARPFTQTFDNRLGEATNSGDVVFTDQTTIQGVRVDISEVATFIAENSQPALAVDGQAALEIVENTLQLAATLQNNSDQRLENVTLLLGDTAVAVGDLDPGEARELSQVLRTVNSSTALNPGAVGSLVSSTTRSPLTGNAATILGSSAYYDDREIYPRFELLSALEPNSMSSSRFSFGSDTAVLLAWTDSSQLDVSLAEGEFDSAATTLHLIGLPLQFNLQTGGQFDLPISMLDWSTLAQNNVYDPNIEDLNLNLGWIEFEYQPWPDFHTMEVSELAINLTAAAGSETYPTPDVSLYDWRTEAWVLTDITDWGVWPIDDPAPFIGENNAVRMRLEDNSDSYGLFIEAVYPVLTGTPQ